MMSWVPQGCLELAFRNFPRIPLLEILLLLFVAPSVPKLFAALLIQKIIEVAQLLFPFSTFHLQLLSLTLISQDHNHVH